MSKTTTEKQDWRVCIAEIVKPLMRFDCFFALLALVLMFWFFDRALHLDYQIVEIDDKPVLMENPYAKYILGAIVMGFQQLSTWAWRTTKASIDKREDEAKT